MGQVLVALFGWVLVSFSLVAMGQNVSPDYWSPGASQWQMTFSHHVQIETASTPEAKRAELQIQNQLTYLFGSLSNNIRAGVPKVNHEFKVEKIQKASASTYDIAYGYNGTVLVRDGGVDYRFLLPVNPDKIYARSVVNKNGRLLYPCGDFSHPQAEYFWYFFNPTASGCPLKAGSDYQEVSAKLTPVPNTQETFPEYDRLIRDGVLRIDILIGMNDSSENFDPLKTTDIGAWAYRSFRKYLVDQGYQGKLWSQDEISKVTGRATQRVFVEEFVKIGPRAELKVRLFFGPTDTYSGRAFHAFYKDALENAAVAIYDGHSGLGEYLDLEIIKDMSGVEITIPNSFYQIYFFNGCSSYPYYNGEFFDFKRTPADPAGTRNLDVLTNGLATFFSAIAPSNLTVFQAFEGYALHDLKTSYQKIVEAADSGNLMGVNGDEDNP